MGENKSRSNGDTSALHYTAAQDCSVDSDTTEIPALGEDDYVDDLAETGEFAPLTIGTGDDTPRQTDQGRASLVLTHLESEIARLQARWENVESELQARETVIEELTRSAKEGQAAISGLRGDVLARDQRLQVAAQSTAERIASQTLTIDMHAGPGGRPLETQPIPPRPPRQPLRPLPQPPR